MYMCVSIETVPKASEDTFVLEGNDEEIIYFPKMKITLLFFFFSFHWEFNNHILNLYILI